jgi:hypothetical protein
VTFAFGHDEYLYDVLGEQLPHAVAWTIRHHSFQSVAEDYLHLMSPADLRLRESHLKPFAGYDLYTKDPHDVNDAHLERYREIMERRFPTPVDW